MTATTTALEIIAMAERHALLSPSAALCLADARISICMGDARNAIRRAIKSLAYSVGVFDADYQAADTLARGVA